MDGLVEMSLLFGFCSFSGAKMLVLGRVFWKDDDGAVGDDDCGDDCSFVYFYFNSNFDLDGISSWTFWVSSWQCYDMLWYDINIAWYIYIYVSMDTDMIRTDMTYICFWIPQHERKWPWQAKNQINKFDQIAILTGFVIIYITWVIHDQYDQLPKHHEENILVEVLVQR